MQTVTIIDADGRKIELQLANIASIDVTGVEPDHEYTFSSTDTQGVSVTVEIIGGRENRG